MTLTPSTLTSCWNIMGRCVLRIPLRQVSHWQLQRENSCLYRLPLHKNNQNLLGWQHVSPMAAIIKREEPAAPAFQPRQVLCSIGEGHDSFDSSGKGLRATSWRLHPAFSFGIPSGQQWAAVSAGNKHSKNPFQRGTPFKAPLELCTCVWTETLRIAP